MNCSHLLLQVISLWRLFFEDVEIPRASPPPNSWHCPQLLELRKVTSFASGLANRLRLLFFEIYREEDRDMRTKKLQFRKFPLVSTMTTFLCLGCGSLAYAQSAAPPNSAQDRDNVKPADGRDTAREQELAHFNEFLDTHRETAEQLRKDPSLANNPQFLKEHPALQTYLQDHPGIGQELKDNPNAFMGEEERFAHSADNRDRSPDRREIAGFNQFLASHREVAERLRKDPSLVDNQEFLKDHPELETYLHEHPGTRQELRDNPNAFMRDEQRYDHNDHNDHNVDNRDRDADRRELANFNQFLDSHRETAERVRKDPSLVDNQEFLKDHPALVSYLHDHPAVREQLKQNPDAFMQEEARYEHRDDDMNRRDRVDRGFRDGGREHVASFGQFLGTHENIAQQLSKDPNLVKNDKYVQDHPELQDYLKMHPDINHELMTDPQAFVKSAQQFNVDNQAVKTPMTPAAAESKPPKQ